MKLNFQFKTASVQQFAIMLNLMLSPLITFSPVDSFLSDIYFHFRSSSSLRTNCGWNLFDFWAIFDFGLSFNPSVLPSSDTSPHLRGGATSVNFQLRTSYFMPPLGVGGFILFQQSLKCLQKLLLR